MQYFLQLLALLNVTASSCLASCGLGARQVCLLIVSIYLNLLLITAFEERKSPAWNKALGTWVEAPKSRWATQWQTVASLIYPVPSSSQIPSVMLCRRLAFYKQLLDGNLKVAFTPPRSQEFQYVSGKHSCVSSGQFEQTRCGWGQNLALSIFIWGFELIKMNLDFIK